MESNNNVKQCSLYQIDGLLLPSAYRFRIPSYLSWDGKVHPPIWVSLQPLAVPAIPRQCEKWGIRKSSFEFLFKRQSPFASHQYAHPAFLAFTYSIPAEHNRQAWTEPALDFVLEAIAMFAGIHLGCGISLCGIGGRGVMGTMSTSARDSGLYEFDEDSWRRFRRFLSSYSSVQEVIAREADLSTARAYILQALAVESRLRLRAEDRILFLTIALEALMLAKGREELSQRMSSSSTWLLRGMDGWDSELFFEIFRRAYEVRSRVAHGTAEPISRDKIKKLGFASPGAFTIKLSFLVREVFIRRTLLANMAQSVKREAVQATFERHTRGATVSLPALPHASCVEVYRHPGHATLSLYMKKHTDESTEWRARVRKSGYPDGLFSAAD